jgi:hypothetical protein
MYVDEGIVEESAFYSKYAETLVYGYEVCNQMFNFRIHEKRVFVCQAAGIDVNPLLAKTCEVDLGHLVSWIAAIAILYFRSSLIVIRRASVLYSVRTFQVAIRRSFLRLLLVFIVLIRSVFFFFFFLNNGFFRPRAGGHPYGMQSCRSPPSLVARV